MMDAVTPIKSANNAHGKAAPVLAYLERPLTGNEPIPSPRV